MVPLIHAEKFKRKLKNAQFVFFENLGHFQISEFPEIVKMMKSDTSKQ